MARESKKISQDINKPNKPEMLCPFCHQPCFAKVLRTFESLELAKNSLHIPIIQFSCEHCGKVVYMKDDLNSSQIHFLP